MGGDDPAQLALGETLSGRSIRAWWSDTGQFQFDLNTGPWTLELVSSDTAEEAIKQYNRPPEPIETPSAPSVPGVT
jgi:hypothetical protein